MNQEKRHLSVLFDDVRFGYDEHAVLDHVSFHVEEGEQVTLSGRTGAGKSTLFKLLLGLYEPQEGEVLVGGIPAGQLTEKRKTKMVWLRGAVLSHGAGND